MGIIEKQATKNAIYQYIGAGLGFVTVMWIAHALTTEENGMRNLLLSYSVLFAQFANLGFTSITSRFFPYFRDKDKGHHGFLFYAMIVSLIGFVLCYIVFLLLQPQLIENAKDKSPLFVSYLFYLMPLTFFTIFFTIFDNYLRATYNSVIGSFSKDFLQRVLILFVLAAFELHLIGFNTFIFLYVFFTCFTTFILLFFIIRQKEWHVRPVRGFITPALRKEMVKLGLYSILTTGAGTFILSVDTIMVNWLLGEGKTGIYGTALQFGVIILIPARSLYRIMSSVVAEAFKKGDMKEILHLYKKSCNSQLAIGAVLFIGIFVNIDNIMHLIPPEYGPGRNVILVLSFGYLIEMATGINNVIMANSKYYRYDAVIVTVMVVVIVIANLIFIPLYGITGSAIATAFTSILSNCIRFTILKRKFGMQPYDANTVKLVLITIVAFIPGYFLPYLHNLIVDIAVRSMLTGGIFVLLTYRLNAAPDLNNKIRKNMNAILGKGIK